MELAAALLTKDALGGALALVLVAPLLYNLWLAFVTMLWTPLRIRRAFRLQGIHTLPFRFFYGNLPELTTIDNAAWRRPLPHVTHDIAPRILPHVYYWAQKYGVPHVHWFGSEARYIVINAEDAQDILSTKFSHYGKPDRRPDSNVLFGNGLVSLHGEKWSQHRRILNRAFYLDKLKAMIPTMEACTVEMMKNWRSSIETGQAIDVQKCLKDLTADIIAHTAFRSSFAEGKRVFDLQCEQKLLIDKLLNAAYIPGSRFLPTAANRFAWKIDRDIKRGLQRVIKKREESMKVGRGNSCGNDLLGLMMAANKHKLQGNQKDLTMSINDMIDECKTFFFAGHETTATLLTWTFLLLATNPEWQARIREEVVSVCGTRDAPTIGSISHLKIMGMVLNEVLRLYPPAVRITRMAYTNMQLGEVVIPKGTVVTLPIIMWHHDERYWGADAHEFRPERFSEGVAKASKVAAAFMPFSMGPRICIGQNFAMLEAKVVLCTILRYYRFHLSPTYKHAPITVIALHAQFGMPILFEKL